VASERGNKLFSKNQGVRSFFGVYSSFQNCFWNLLSTSSLSQNFKIRNVWKLLSPFSRNTVIWSSTKSSWSLKKHFLEENRSKNFKNGHKIFSHPQSFHGLGTFCLGILKPRGRQIYRNIILRKKFSCSFLNLMGNGKL
jgi:CMP-N-acetylneuraminic acid synthetase